MRWKKKKRGFEIIPWNCFITAVNKSGHRRGCYNHATRAMKNLILSFTPLSLSHKCSWKQNFAFCLLIWCCNGQLDMTFNGVFLYLSVVYHRTMILKIYCLLGVVICTCCLCCMNKLPKLSAEKNELNIVCMPLDSGHCANR